MRKSHRRGVKWYFLAGLSLKALNWFTDSPTDLKNTHADDENGRVLATGAWV